MSFPSQMKRAGQTMLVTSALVAGSLTTTVAAQASNGISAGTAASCSAPGNKVANGGIERGARQEWIFTPIGQVRTGTNNRFEFVKGLESLSHSGLFAANLGLHHPSGQPYSASMSQDVTVPAGCRATLDLWLWINSLNPPSSTDKVFDTLTIKLGDTTVGSFNNLDRTTTSAGLGKPSSYVERIFDVSSFAGRTVTLSFTANETQPFRPTFFQIDDVSLNAF